jgi:hypothetical protein
LLLRLFISYLLLQNETMTGDELEALCFESHAELYTRGDSPETRVPFTTSSTSGEDSHYGSHDDHQHEWGKKL